MELSANLPTILAGLIFILGLTFLITLLENERACSSPKCKKRLPKACVPKVQPKPLCTPKK